MAQSTDPCEFCKEILKEGLYKTIISTRTQDFSQDLRTYFLSEELKKDLREGKWGATLDVVIDAVPIGVKANDSETNISEFQKRVESATSLQLAESTFEQLKTTIPDPEIARIYKDCLAECGKVGFKVYATSSDNDAMFIIRYDPQVPGDPMPKVEFFDILNGADVRNAPKEDDTLEFETIITSQRNPEKDLVLILQTDRGQASSRVSGQPSGFNKDLPVGTIISSYLNFQQFGEVTKNNESNPDRVNIWTAKFSKWAPCDGRAVSDSKFELFNATVPDLRGQFLRGLNLIDTQPPQSVPALTDARRDPQPDRAPGSFQGDTFQIHSHSISDPGHAHNYTWRSVEGGGSSVPDGKGQGYPSKTETTTISTTGIANTNNTGDPNETRPKNVAVYYYIRIN